MTKAVQSAAGVLPARAADTAPRKPAGHPAGHAYGQDRSRTQRELPCLAADEEAELSAALPIGRLQPFCDG